MRGFLPVFCTRKQWRLKAGTVHLPGLKIPESISLTPFPTPSIKLKRFIRTNLSDEVFGEAKYLLNEQAVHSEFFPPLCILKHPSVQPRFPHSGLTKPAHLSLSICF